MRVLAALPDDGQEGAWQTLANVAAEYGNWMQPVTLPVLFPRVTIEAEGMTFERPAILTPG